jgi:Uma2 family endonuclease
MATDTRLITAEELLCMPDPDNGMRRELINGRIVELMPPTYEHNEIMAQLTILLGVHVNDRNLGRVIAGDVGVILRRGPDTVRGPDVCFIAAENLPTGTARQRYLDVVPDLFVEIVSPSDRVAEVRRKTGQWLQAGARLVLTVHPKTRTVVASLPGGTERVYQADDVLTLEPVLPDFSVPVAEIFR